MARTKTIIRFVPGALLLLCLSMQEAWADGLASMGHVNGPHTVVKLNQNQIKRLDQGADKITITPEQRQLFKKLPNFESVKFLRIYPPDVHTCTCELTDVALRTSKNTIEVADFLFGRNFRQFGITPWDIREDEQIFGEEAEMLAASPTKEAILNNLGNNAKNTYKLKEAAGYFQQALKVNPNHKWARRNLASTYSCMSVDAYRKDDYKTAIEYTEMALNTAASDDQLFRKSETESLTRMKLKAAKAKLH
jgi:tetratricopeptide (TPR) repeat protein